MMTALQGPVLFTAHCAQNAKDAKKTFFCRTCEYIYQPSFFNIQKDKILCVLCVFAVQDLVPN